MLKRQKSNTPWYFVSHWKVLCRGSMVGINTSLDVYKEVKERRPGSSRIEVPVRVVTDGFSGRHEWFPLVSVLFT